MPKLSIYLHAVDGPDLETSEVGTIEAVRKALGPEADKLVYASELASALGPHRPLWASRLALMEEPHMVRLVVADH